MKLLVFFGMHRPEVSHSDVCTDKLKEEHKAARRLYASTRRTALGLPKFSSAMFSSVPGTSDALKLLFATSSVLLKFHRALLAFSAYKRGRTQVNIWMQCISYLLLMCVFFFRSHKQQRTRIICSEAGVRKVIDLGASLSYLITNSLVSTEMLISNMEEMWNKSTKGTRLPNTLCCFTVTTANRLLLGKDEQACLQNFGAYLMRRMTSFWLLYCISF